MTAHQQRLPGMPEIGRPEAYYARLVRLADATGDLHAHEAAKVGQYVTLGLDPSLAWSQKVRYFQHALKRHCVPPPLPDEDVWIFYRGMACLVREHCGTEALKLASHEDDTYAQRRRLGIPEDLIDDEAEAFFNNLMGLTDMCPFHFHEDDWHQLIVIRDQWI